MDKETSPIQIEQIFSKTSNGQKSLQRMIVWDNDLAYDVTWTATKFPFVRMMRRAPDGIFYEVATKAEGKSCEHKYAHPDYRDTIYENMGNFGKRESVVALAYDATGTVRGAIVLPHHGRGFNIFCGDGKWASFELTPNGVQYIQEVEGELQPKLSAPKKVGPNAPIVMIDGKRVKPIERKAVLPLTVYRRPGRE